MQPRAADKAKTLGTNIRARVHLCRAIGAIHHRVLGIGGVHPVAAQIFGAWSFIAVLGHVKKSTIESVPSHTFFGDTHGRP